MCPFSSTTGWLAAVFAAALLVAGCGSSSIQAGPGGSTSSTSAGPHAHPQAIEPQAGVGASGGAVTDSSGAPVGDPNAHAPSLGEVKKELARLNLCGGTTNPALAAPLTAATKFGFVPDPGTTQNVGQLPILTARLNSLGQALHVTIFGISGYRTPQHSVAVGGFADDPHTKGEAEDVGVGSLLRSSAAQISEQTLSQFGLYRPFDPSDDPNNSEVNHIQLIPKGGPLLLAQAQAAYDPDPSCS